VSGLQGSPKPEICDEHQIILAICASGEFFAKSILKEPNMASKAATFSSTDLTEPDSAAEEREGLLCSSREQEIRNRAYEIYLPSGVTSKPASRGHFKTGQLNASRTAIVLPHQRQVRQEFSFRSSLHSIYTDFTWAEDRATQGCDPSADPAAGMAGRRQPPQERTTILAENAINPRGLGTESPRQESLLPIWFPSGTIQPHLH
jgi:hypothetical protein